MESLIKDERILNLIRNSMKLKHITTVKPCLNLIGNLVKDTDYKIEEELIKLPEFLELITFCLESEAYNLIGRLFWVISNMVINPVVVDYFIIDIDILKKVVYSFLNHKDIIVQKEACYTLFYCLNQCNTYYLHNINLAQNKTT